MPVFPSSPSHGSTLRAVTRRRRLSRRLSVALAVASSAAGLIASPALADTPDTTPPSQVTGVSATVNFNSQPADVPYADVHWSAATDDVAVTDYDVYVAGSLKASVPGTATSASRILVGQSLHMPFTVVARDAAGNASPASAPFTLNTCGFGPPAYGVASKVSVSNVTPTTADLSWEAPDGGDTCFWQGIGHGVEILLTANGTTTDLGSTQSTHFSLTGLASNVNYSVTLQTIGASLSTKPIQFTTPLATSPAPTKVTGVNVVRDPNSIAGNQFNVTWTAATDDVGVTSYEVYGGSTLVATVPGAATYALSVAIEGDRSTPITVVARDADGNASPPSDPVVFDTCPAVNVPTVGPPTSVTASGQTGDGATISWIAPSTEACGAVGATGYDVYLATGVGVPATLAGSTTATSFDLTGLQPDHTYLVFVRAKGGAAHGGQADSATVQFTTAPGTTPPPTPTPETTHVDYGVTGSATLKSLAKGTLPLTGHASLTVTRQQISGSPTPVGTFTGDLSLNQTTANLKALGFLPVTATLAFVQAAPFTGSTTDASATATAKVRIKLPSLKILGVSLGGGATCQASQITTIGLFSSAPLLDSGGTLAGSFSISNLTGCGALNGLVSPLTSGSGNAIALKLAPATA